MIRQWAPPGIEFGLQHETSYRHIEPDISQNRILACFVGFVLLRTLAKRTTADGVVTPVHQ